MFSDISVRFDSHAREEPSLSTDQECSISPQSDETAQEKKEMLLKSMTKNTILEKTSLQLLRRSLQTSTLLILLEAKSVLMFFLRVGTRDFVSDSLKVNMTRSTSLEIRRVLGATIMKFLQMKEQLDTQLPILQRQSRCLMRCF